MGAGREISHILGKYVVVFKFIQTPTPETRQNSYLQIFLTISRINFHSSTKYSYGFRFSSLTRRFWTTLKIIKNSFLLFLFVFVVSNIMNTVVGNKILLTFFAWYLLFWWHCDVFLINFAFTWFQNICIHEISWPIKQQMIMI